MMTMKVALSEFMGCENWSKAELCKVIDNLAEDILERDKLIQEIDMQSRWYELFGTPERAAEYFAVQPPLRQRYEKDRDRAYRH